MTVCPVCGNDKNKGSAHEPLKTVAEALRRKSGFVAILNHKEACHQVICGEIILPRQFYKSVKKTAIED